MKGGKQRVERYPDWWLRMGNYKECKSVGCYERTYNGKDYCNTHYSVAIESLVDSVVYFILSPESASVKIGYTSDLKKRMSRLQTSSPFDLVLYTTIRGDIDDEEEIHKYLAEFRMKGEWFKTTDEVIELISIAENFGMAGIEKHIESKQ